MKFLKSILVMCLLCLGASAAPILQSGWTTTTDPATARAALGIAASWTNVTTLQTNATTAEIQSAFDAGGAIWFTPSIYPYALTTNIYITNKVVVYGNYNVFTPSSLSLSNGMFTSRTNVPNGPSVFKDCKFDGGVHNAYSTTTNYFSLLNGTPTLYYNPYWSNRTALVLSSQPGGLIQNCEFYRWPGNGLLLVNQGSTGAFTNGRVAVAFSRFYSNFCGLYLPGSAYETAGYYNNPAPWQQAVPEYQPVYGCEFYQNYMGLGGGAANGHIQQCMFTANFIGTHLTASINNGAHGIYDNSTWNHNIYGFWAESCQLGGFKNNRLLGNIRAAFIGSSITECQIEGNWFGLGSVIITNNSTGFFSRNAYQGSWSNTFACAITNAVTVCDNYSTTVAGNNDGISCNNSQGGTLTTNNATLSGLTKGNGARGVINADWSDVQALTSNPILTNNHSAAVVFGNTITGNGSGLTNVNETVETLTYSGSTVTIDWSKSFGRLTVTKATTLDVSNIASNSFGHVYRLLCVQDSAGTWAVTPSTNHIRTQGGSVNGWIANPTNAGAEFTIEFSTGFYGTNIYAGQSGAAWLP